MIPSEATAPGAGLSSADWFGALWNRLPPWVRDDVAPATVARAGAPLDTPGGDARLVAARVANARDRTGAQFEAGVADAYRSLFAQAADAGCHLVRCWNFIPGIDDALEDGINRYMAFNAGRFTGYRARFGADGPPPAAIATASGVGTPGRDVLVAALACREPGIPVENPRQVPAYRYSARYGPLPPCFSRATLQAGGGRLLVGGTSSVRGEVSVHADTVHGQLEETILNLDVLVAEGARVAGIRLAGPRLAHFTSARVYVVDAGDAEGVRQRLVAAGMACPIETVVARLCRPELRIEIEGVVALRERTLRPS
jgi:chorismate lyase/3-hydroxybenzoate synthase